MNKITITLVLLFSSVIFSQETITIDFNENAELKLNDVIINNETSFKTIIELLGEPVLVKEFKTGKKNYIFPKTGLAVQTYKDKLLMIGANYNWDGDKNFPETTYTGKLSVGKTTIDASSTKELLKKISFLEFMPMFSELYIAASEKAKLAVMIGFKDDKITQIGFELKPI